MFSWAVYGAWAGLLRLFGFTPSTHTYFSLNFVESLSSRYDSNDADVQDIQVNILFLTHSGVQFRELWEEWYNQAADDINNLMGINDTHHILMGWGTWKEERDVIANCTWPTWVTPVAPQPATAAWAKPNSAIHRLLSLVLRRTEEYVNGVFITISESHIPLKPFIEIYKDIVADPRTRFSAWIVDYPYCVPKTSAWYMLSRPHAKMLAASPQVWVKNHWYLPFYLRIWSDRKDSPVAAEDEFYTFDGLLALISPLHRSKDSCPSESDFPDSVRMIMQKPLDMRSSTFVFWHEAPVETSAKYIGGGQAGGAHPLHFHRIEAGFLKYLNEQSDVWFMRKITPQTFVPHCYQKALANERYVSHTSDSECGIDIFAPKLAKMTRNKKAPASEVHKMTHLLNPKRLTWTSSYFSPPADRQPDTSQEINCFPGISVPWSPNDTALEEQLTTTPPPLEAVVPSQGGEHVLSASSTFASSAGEGRKQGIRLLPDWEFYTYWIGLSQEDRRDPHPFRVHIQEIPEGRPNRPNSRRLPNQTLMVYESPRPSHACGIEDYMKSLISHHT